MDAIFGLVMSCEHLRDRDDVSRDQWGDAGLLLLTLQAKRKSDDLYNRCKKLLSQDNMFRIHLPGKVDINNNRRTILSFMRWCCGELYVEHVRAPQILDHFTCWNKAKKDKSKCVGCVVMHNDVKESFFLLQTTSLSFRDLPDEIKLPIARPWRSTDALTDYRMTAYSFYDETGDHFSTCVVTVDDPRPRVPNVNEERILVMYVRGMQVYADESSESMTVDELSDSDYVAATPPEHMCIPASDSDNDSPTDHLSTECIAESDNDSPTASSTDDDSADDATSSNDNHSAGKDLSHCETYPHRVRVPHP
jgi:hypothetical protein